MIPTLDVRYSASFETSMEIETERSYYNFCLALQQQVSHTGTLGFSNGIGNYQTWLADRCHLWHRVTILTISNPRITVLPPEIGEFIHLRTLKLQECCLTEFPNELSHLTLLQELWLHKNPLDLNRLNLILPKLFSLKKIHLASEDTPLIDYIGQNFPHIRLEIS